MALKVAFQMDPIERIDIRGDSTFALLLEAQWRGHDVFYYTPNNLSLSDGRLIAEGHSLTVEDRPGDHYRLAHPRKVDLADYDVVHLRQDPPFDMAYITTTHLLERLQPRTVVVNDPASVRNAPEKIFVLDFLDLMPPTLVTRSVEEIKQFRAEHKDIVVKPLYGNGGAAIFRIPKGDTNLNSLVELLGMTFREPIMVQRYLPEVRKGDKRIDSCVIAVAGATPGLESAFHHARVIGESQNFTRELVNEPGNLLPPLELAARAQAMANEQGLECEILDRDKMTQLGMGSLLGVAQGSAFPRR